MRMGEGISDLFDSTISVKQGCPLSPTLFGLCIDELEQIITKFVKEKFIEEVIIRNIVIMLLLYANEIVLFANTLEGAQI